MHNKGRMGISTNGITAKTWYKYKYNIFIQAFSIPK